MNKDLIVFARQPIPGQVKTRLAATIGDHSAAELYELMLQDVLGACRYLNDVESFVYWACEDVALPLLTKRYRCNSRRQCPGDLGQRMQAAFVERFECGGEICCIIGSDAPDLPPSYLQEAFEKLEAHEADIVFGPASDGGYYLLGLRQLWPQLFIDIPWSTSLVLERSLLAARDAGAIVALLPHWHDIDSLQDWQAFQERKRKLHETTSDHRSTAG